MIEDAEQLHLHLEREIADLVEERVPRSARRTFRLARDGSGERATLVAKQLGLEDLGGDRRAVDRQESRRATRGVLVERVRDELFAGSRLADDENVLPGGGDELHLARQGLHGLRVTDQPELLSQPALELHDLRWARLSHAPARCEPRSMNGLGQVGERQRSSKFRTEIERGVPVIIFRTRIGGSPRAAESSPNSSMKGRITR